jgi:methylthioribose-1-phosphate isomerase
MEKLNPIRWDSGQLLLLDQRLVPSQKKNLECRTLQDVYLAIQNMAVRGAPAIAVAGAFGNALFFRNRSNKPSYQDWEAAMEFLISSRPTAINISRMVSDFRNHLPKQEFEKKSLEELQKISLDFALSEFDRDIAANKNIAKNALPFFESSKDHIHIITHCNTGALATAGYGTALGIIRGLRDSGKKVTVYAEETRPYLQGSRLTAFEMLEEDIECYVITDGMSSWLMNDRKIDAVIVGCDRIAANGDVANKIGTQNLAIIANEFNVPFYVAGTKDSFDRSAKTGADIPIEMRDPTEVTSLSFLKSDSGSPLIGEGILAPKGIRALNPSFDVTPAKYIKKIFTEFGAWSPGQEIPA